MKALFNRFVDWLHHLSLEDDIRAIRTQLTAVNAFAVVESSRTDTLQNKVAETTLRLDENIQTFRAVDQQLGQRLTKSDMDLADAVRKLDDATAKLKDFAERIHYLENVVLKRTGIKK